MSVESGVVDCWEACFIGTAAQGNWANQNKKGRCKRQKMEFHPHSQITTCSLVRRIICKLAFEPWQEWRLWFVAIITMFVWAKKVFGCKCFLCGYRLVYSLQYRVYREDLVIKETIMKQYLFWWSEEIDCRIWQISGSPESCTEESRGSERDGYGKIHLLMTWGQCCASAKMKLSFLLFKIEVVPNIYPQNWNLSQ